MTVDLLSDSDRIWLGQRVRNWTKNFFVLSASGGHAVQQYCSRFCLADRYCKKVLPKFVGQNGI